MIRQEKYNGRVNIITPDITNLFALYDRIPAKQCTSLHNATEGLWDDTNLSVAYFSKENIQIVQNGIRAGVYHKSKGQYIIAPQNCDTIKIIMRSVFLQSATNQPTHIAEQIENLNKMVINYCIEALYGEVQGYYKYLSDASTLVVPLSNPIMTDNNDRELEFKRWF